MNEVKKWNVKQLQKQINTALLSLAICSCGWSVFQAEAVNPDGTVSNENTGVAIGAGSYAFGSGVSVGNQANSQTADSRADKTVAIGNKAKTITTRSIAIGDEAVAGKEDMDNPQDPNNRTTVGKQANIAIGHGAVAYGGRNVSMGEYAGIGTPDNWNISNVNIGDQAGQYSKKDYSVAVGYQAGSLITSALRDKQWAVADADRAPSVFIGKNAGTNAVSYGIIGIGKNAAKNVTDVYSSNSIAIGNDAGAGMTSDDNMNRTFRTFGSGANILLGGAAGNGLSGDGNLALGNIAGRGSRGDNNIYLGHLAGDRSTNDRTIIIGAQSGSYKLTNDRSIFIGSAVNLTDIQDGQRTRNSIGIGTLSRALENETIAIGFVARAIENNAIAMGKFASSSSRDAIAVGTSAASQGPSSTAVGNGANSTAESAISLGTSANSTGVGAIAVGKAAEASGENALALGTGSIASGQSAGAMGSNSQATGDGSYVVGNESIASGTDTFVIGNHTTGTIHNSVYLGSQSQAVEQNGNNLTVDGTLGETTTGGAMGTVDTATIGNLSYDGFAASQSTGAVTVGAAGAERRIMNVAAGEISETSTDAINGSQLYSVAQKMKATTDVAVAAAKTEVTSNNNTVAVVKRNGSAGQTIYDLSVDMSAARLSYKANGTGSEGVTLRQGLNFRDGKNTTATVAPGGVVKYSLNDDITLSSVTADNLKGNTLVIGDRVTVNDNGIDMGGAAITNVQAGNVSADSTEVVNGAQLYHVKEQVNGNTAAIENLGGNVGSLGHRMDTLDVRVKDVGAGAAALAALHPQDFDPDDKWDFALGYGNYRGANAWAVGAFYRPTEDILFSVGGSFAGDERMVNAGLTFKLGQGNHVSRSRVAMAREILDLKDENKALKDRLDMVEQKMNRMLGIFDVSKQKDFPDVPANHWAYEYVATLAGNGIITGYPDGTFRGQQSMTRYEFAALVYRALQNGAKQDVTMDKLQNEFADELRDIRADRIRVDRISGEDNERNKVERVRLNDEDREADKIYKDLYGSQIEKNGAKN